MLKKEKKKGSSLVAQMYLFQLTGAKLNISNNEIMNSVVNDLCKL